jgi:osmotically inducible protein OsmC
MPTRIGEAVWEGPLMKGKGWLTTETGALKKAKYSAGSRFEDKKGTNPEELIAAAQAGCYSMALALVLGKEGFKNPKISTTARVTIEESEGGFVIPKIVINTEAQMEGLEEEKFKEIAKKAKEVCPVSNALKGPEIEVEATLLHP